MKLESPISSAVEKTGAVGKGTCVFKVRRKFIQPLEQSKKAHHSMPELIPFELIDDLRDK
jgi:hypothetical protein